MGWRVIYYTTRSGNNPVRDFLDSCSERQQAKVLGVVENIESYGLQSVVQHLRKLKPYSLWEIRIPGRDNIRVIYVVPLAETVLLLHGFIKKSQDTSSREIAIAQKRLSERKLDT